MQNHDVVRLVLQTDHLDTFYKVSDRFDRCLQTYLDKCKTPQYNNQTLAKEIQKWVDRSKFKLSDAGKTALESLLKIKDDTNPKHLI
eukprot:UN28823